MGRFSCKIGPGGSRESKILTLCWDRLSAHSDECGPGQAHDVTAFPALMQELDCDPEQLLGDKGYDSNARKVKKFI